MSRTLFLLILLFLSQSLRAQQFIEGTVIDQANNKPLAGASVFISNTSRGTTSNSAGSFRLDNIPGGRYELIISSVGFETSVYAFSSEQLPLKVRVEMLVKVRELPNVTVEPSVVEGWEKWGQTFTESFIGMIPNAKQVRIRNQKKIKFRYYKQSNRVIAYCDEPLQIENKALGYILRYQLEDFEVNFRAGTITFSGYPLFEDMHKEGKKLKNRWRSARDEAYHGSMVHFARALYRDSLESEGFNARRMIRTPNYERERVSRIYRGNFMGGNIRVGNAAPMRRQRVDSLGSVAAMPPGALRDSIALWGKRADSMVVSDSSAYYRSVMEQENHIDTYLPGKLTLDSLLVNTEGDFKVIWFSDYLFVTYKHELEDPVYLQRHQLRRSPQPQSSHIWLVNGSPVAIDRNGSFYPPQEIFSMSYWGWSEKIADLLPLDYEPEIPKK